MKRKYSLFLEILGTLILAILTAEVGFYALCLYSPVKACNQNGSYTFVAVFSTFVVLASFFVVQYKKTHKRIAPKNRNPLPVSTLSKTFGNTFQVLWDYESSEDKVEVKRDEGWVVEFADGVPVVISEREFYHFLLEVISKRRDYDLEGLGKMRSPLSFRSHPNIPTRTMKAYRQLLRDMHATVKLNYNVEVLKDIYEEDPWKLVEIMKANIPTIYV